MRRSALLAGGLIAALCYLLAISKNLFYLEVLAKPWPVVCLILWIWPQESSRYKKWILAGLMCSIIGDLLMTRPDRWLIPAMGSFGLAHLSYIFAYLTVSRRVFPLKAIPFIIWCALVHWQLSPKMGEMLVPVTGYMILIGIMMWRALAMVRTSASRSQWVAPLGAIIFALSDTMIAIHLFEGSFSWDRHLIIISYWLGQSLIATSVFIYAGPGKNRADRNQ